VRKRVCWRTKRTKRAAQRETARAQSGTEREINTVGGGESKIHTASNALPGNSASIPKSDMYSRSRMCIGAVAGDTGDCNSPFSGLSQAVPLHCGKISFSPSIRTCLWLWYSRHEKSQDVLHVLWIAFIFESISCLNYKIVIF